MNFVYKARDNQGRLTTGALQAATQAGAISALQAKGLSPVSLQPAANAVQLPVEKAIRSPVGLRQQRRVTQREVIFALKQLSRLLTAGIPLDKALKMLLVAVSNKAFAQRLAMVQEVVEGGQSVSAGFATALLNLPTYAICLIKAGELSGDLEGALTTVADSMERNARTKAMVKNSLTYPAIMVVASLLALILLFTFMLPRFTFVDSLSGASSSYLQMLLRISAFLRMSGGPILILMIGALLTHRLWLRRAVDWVQAFLLQSPLIGRPMRTAAAARLLRCLGALLQGGVTLPEALAAAQEAAGYQAFTAAVQLAQDQVSHGATLSAVWKQMPIMPPIVGELAKVGEETGDLAMAFLQGADILEEELQQWMNRFTAVFEPALILMIAGVVGFVVISILLPVINITDIPI